MKLGYRIFFGYLLIFSICFYYPINWMLDNLRVRYLEGVEEPLVDHANLLADLVGQQMETGVFSTEQYHEAFSQTHRRQLRSLRQE